MLSDSQPITILSFADWFIFMAVFLITILSVWWGNHLKSKLSSNEQNSLVELLLMGRKLTLPLFIATLVATWYGGIFGVTALTYEKGIFNFLTQGIFWYFSYFIFAFFLVKKIKNSNAMTLPEVSAQMFGPKAEKVTALLNFLNLLPIAYTISLGLFLKALFGGPLFLNTLIGVGIVTLYSLWGGFRAVVFSDLIQFFFMLISVILVIVFSWMKFGSPESLIDQLPSTHLDPTGGEPISVLLIWGFIALSTLVDPNFYQRCLAAKDEQTAKRGIIISIIIWFIFDCCTTLGALYAKVHLPNSIPEEAYLNFSLQILPSGVRGLFLAGILATILSTLDSYLFNAATCLSYDLFEKKLNFKIAHHHIALIFVSFLSVIIGIFFDGDIISVWKILGSFSSACLLFPIIMGFALPGKISEKRFIIACLAGSISIIAWRILNYFYQLYPLDEFYVGLLFTTIILLPALLKNNRQLS
jgi:SSS family solute:Na+ symporter